MIEASDILAAASSDATQSAPPVVCSLLFGRVLAVD